MCRPSYVHPSLGDRVDTEQEAVEVDVRGGVRCLLIVL
jgi:hypothetical protein